MWILALPLTALALSVGVYGLLWLIERGGEEYPARLPLSDKGATGTSAPLSRHKEQRARRRGLRE